ncbi:enoyl-CoA hydratase/isomerase family protein [Bacillus subtilis]|nr:enoyl-CoA hydratase/isomerase family protein [Bacillus subtilis]
MSTSDNPDTDDITYRVEGAAAIITLDRPRRHNAFTFEMIAAWPEMLCRAQADARVSAIVLTGAGGTFCSGVDLRSLAEVDPTPLSYKEMLTERIHHVALTLERLDKPVIAAMEGKAVGAGLDMALMCDMRIAGRTAEFTEGYVSIGLVPGDGGGYFLPRLVGPAKAMELLLTGDPIGAEEALNIGMLNHLAEEGQALDRALALVERIARHPQKAVRLIKRTVRESMHSDLPTALDLVSSHFGLVACSEESQAIIGNGRR